ncbi:hypothetical protein ACSVBT_04880 [Afipia sp. TerB]
MKSIILSTLSAGLSRILAILLNVLGLPMALASLGQSRFALLLTVLSIGSWIGFANVGMGRVIANIIARDRKGASRFMIRSISTATVLAAGLNLALFCVSSAIFLLVVSHVPLNDLIANNYNSFIVSVISLFLALAMWFFLSVFEGIDAGHHQLHRLYLFQLASYAISLVLLFTVFPTHPSIWLAAYLLNLSFLLGSVFHAIDVVRRHRNLFAFEFDWDSRILRHLLLSSVDFTIISLGIGILFQLATGLFGFIVGPQEVFDLGIFMRLMQSYGALVIAFTYPLSNIIATHLAARHNAAAVHTARLSGALLLGAASIAAIVFFAFANEILSFWLRTAIHLDGLFLVCAAMLIVLSALHFYAASLLIGTSDTKAVARIHLGEAVAFAPFAFVLFFTLGEGGVLLALDLTLATGLYLMMRRVLAHRALGAFFSRAQVAAV